MYYISVLKMIWERELTGIMTTISIWPVVVVIEGGGIVAA